LFHKISIYFEFVDLIIWMKPSNFWCEYRHWSGWGCTFCKHKLIM